MGDHFFYRVRTVNGDKPHGGVGLGKDPEYLILSGSAYSYGKPHLPIFGHFYFEGFGSRMLNGIVDHFHPPDRVFIKRGLQ
jgi:hypothetical protein